MHRFRWLAAAFFVLSLAISMRSASAQKVEVNVLYRQDSDVLYHAVVPGYSGPNADITGACTLDPDPANCPDPSKERSEVATPLLGTTLSLGLPDGRIAVVNCVDRHSAKGNYINRHSCGMPLTARAEAEFNGESAKLIWTVGSDKQKIESETYRVVAVLAKPAENKEIADAQGTGTH